MSKIIPMRPKKAYVMTGDAGKAHSSIQGFEPELPKEIWFGGVSFDTLKMPDAEVEALLGKANLIRNTQNDIGEFVADHLRLGGNEFVSPAFYGLLGELEPGVHRAFAVQVISKLPIGGKTEHGTFYWLRPPPIIDCVLFPRTKTRADIKGNPWEKIDRFSPDGLAQKWGGGVAFSRPAYIDGARIEGHHFWWTRQGPGSSYFTQLPTWSEALLAEVRKRKLVGWRVGNEFNIIYS